MFTFTIEDFVRLRDFIYKRTGIFFEEKKIYFVKRRIIERMKELGLETGKEYYRYLKFKDLEKKEFQNLINMLTTNETYFFREYYQLQVFGEELLADFEEKKIKNSEELKLRIWSAGCSTGEEPYTLAIIVMEILDDYKKWDIEIIATDIDETVLEKAKKGHYGSRAVKDVPLKYLEKYFFKLSDNEYAIKDDVKKLVTFRKLNLMDAVNIRHYKGMDYIFCRNVLIYFSDDARKEVVAHFYNSLNPGGFIFLGHSESLSRITTAFRLKKVKDVILYYKPEK